MIRNINKVVADYTTAYKQALEVHKQAVGFIKENYREGSNIYKDAMKTANETFYDTIEPMRSPFIKSVEKEFEEAREKVKNVVAVLPTPEIQGLISLIKNGQLKEEELNMMISTFRGNYMDYKLLCDAIGDNYKTIERRISLDIVMDNLNKLEGLMKNFIKTYSGKELENISYRNALVLNGAYLEDVNNLVNEFVDTFTVEKKGGEE